MPGAGEPVWRPRRKRPGPGGSRPTRGHLLRPAGGQGATVGAAGGGLRGGRRCCRDSRRAGRCRRAAGPRAAAPGGAGRRSPGVRGRVDRGRAAAVRPRSTRAHAQLLPGVPPDVGDERGRLPAGRHDRRRRGEHGARAAAAGALGVVGRSAGIAGGVLGIPLAGYTGVLLSSTAMPGWNIGESTLPPLFLSSGAATTGSLLRLAPIGAARPGDRGRDDRGRPGRRARRRGGP